MFDFLLVNEWTFWIVMAISYMAGLPLLLNRKYEKVMKTFWFVQDERYNNRWFHLAFGTSITVLYLAGLHWIGIYNVLLVAATMAGVIHTVTTIIHLLHLDAARDDEVITITAIEYTKKSSMIGLIFFAGILLSILFRVFG